MMAKKFLRRTSNRYSKLGKKRKKKQVWRKPKGRDNKMREKRKGYPVVVSIGYRKKESDRKKIFTIRNMQDLGKIGKDNVVMIGKIGRKNKIEIVKKLNEMKISVKNLNIKKFLKDTDKERKNEPK
jgi:large subunit ribosomal protein L32e